MSLLLGVRGSSQNTEGQPFREGIIQQPGSFYNGNPSSSIWGKLPQPPLWGDLPLSNGISSSSSSSLTAVPSTSSASLGFKSNISMAQDDEENQWQQQQQPAFSLKKEIATGKGLQEDAGPLRVGEYGYHSDNMQQYRHSDPSGSQFSFGFSSRPMVFGRDTTASNSFKFIGKGSSQEFPDTGKLSSGLFDEGGRKAGAEATANWKNEKSWKFVNADSYSSQSAGFGMSNSVEDLRKNLESRLSMQSPLTTSSVQHTTNSENSTQVVENDSAPALGESTCTTEASGNLEHVNFSEPKITFSEKKKSPEVFVFGASESSKATTKSNAPQQKSYQSSYAASSSRARGSKFKRQSTTVKGKGLAPLGGMQQSAMEFSRDASPQMTGGLDSNTDSSHLDEAECSEADAGIWPEENLDTGINFETNEILQSLHTMGERGLQDEHSTLPLGGLSSTPKEDKYTDYDFDRCDYLSHNEETQPIKNRQNLGTLFGSWWPFHNKSDGDSRHKWEVGGSSNTSKVEYNAAHSGDEMGSTSTAPKQPDLFAGYGKPFDISQNQMDTYPDVSESLDKTSSNQAFSGLSFVKEPVVRGTSAGEYGAKSGWKFDSKEPLEPFVFGVSRQFQTETDFNSERGYGGLDSTSISENAGPLKNEKLRVNSKDFSLGCDQSIASELTSLFTSFSAGTDSSTVAHEGPSSTDRQPFVHPAILTDNEPAKNLFHNLNSLDSLSSSSFVDCGSEFPTGEFSGPLSSSESSASESSPTRAEREKPFNTTQFFEFQGSSKQRTAIGKKKYRASSHIRKQGRGASRLRRFAQSTSFKDTAATPMDYSPGVNDAGLSSGAANLEQPYWNSNGAMNLDDTEILRQLSEFQNMKDFTTAAAGLSIGNDQESIAFQNDKQVSENLNDWTDHKVSSKRSGKWKRLGSDEGQSSSTYWENKGVAQHPTKEDESLADGYMFLNEEDTSYEPTFTFVANSSTTNPSSLHRRFARRPQKGKGVETFEGFNPVDPTTAGGPDGSEIIDQDKVLVPEAKVGPGYFRSPVTVDKKGSPKALSINNKHTSSHSRNAEEFTVLNTDSSLSGRHFVSEIPESPSAVKSAAAEQVCEKWRLRGNQAYANGDFPKAEEYYSRGASSVSPDETSQSCIRASMLCYSNRAATRMAVGRMREALADCKRAMVVDPSFLRVRLRAASCHLALGESKAAADMFKECLKYAKESIKPDNKILSEAMEGAKKSQQLDEYSDRALELLQTQTIMDSTSALRLINEALSISSFSEPLLELKAQALLSLRRYEECLQLCEQSLAAAERNHGFAVNEQQHQDFSLKESCQSTENNHLKLWRWRLSAKASYYLGKLDESLDLLVKHEDALSMGVSDKATSIDSLAPFLANVRDLLRHKAAGNEAFQVGKHAEAVEHYTAALACNGDSRPYIAVCFCNRAAASQALGHIADAIADCSRAIALDSNYPKALSRRATLHEMIRDYGQACNDLRRLVTLLEDYQVHGKNNQTTKGGGLNINAQDLRQARERLDKGEEEMKKSYPIDHYLVLGVDFLSSAGEIKKAYRKAALKHHPDKAGQFLVRGENGDDGSLWKEVGDEVRRDAERLFKLIGEAYAILSDPTKRLRYDADEEHRKQRGKDSNNQMSNSSTESYRSQYEKSGRRQRDRWDAWQGYAPQHQRWQSGPDAAQPDTYGRRSMYGADPAKTGKASWNTDFSWDKI